MSKHHTHLFTYGSLMFAPVWSRVAKRLYRNSEETIQGFARYQVIGEEYPAVIPEPTRPQLQLSGRVYWDVDANDLASLDRFEGEDYERINTLTVTGETVALYVYLRAEKICERGWDPQWFVDVGMPRFLARYPGFNP
jgi:gamma-glutamylcyclotransferase (GGCT)/AIG2-like uncharacterized protein YtfP